MKVPTVSVIIPTYNRAGMLIRAIESVLLQSYQDFDIIVVDDCSTDNTEEADGSLNDSRITYLKLDSNSGGSFVPRSLALKKASGKYIAVLDDDSLWLNHDKLKEQVEFLDSNPDYVLVGTNAASLNLSQEIIAYIEYPIDDRSIRRKMLNKNCFFHPSVMYRNSASKAIGGYRKFGVRPFENYSNDYELWLALGCIAQIANLPMCGAGSVLRTRRVRLKERYGFMTSFMRLISSYRFSYPNYGYSIIYWFLTTTLDVALLRWLKSTIVRSIANGKS